MSPVADAREFRLFEIAFHMQRVAVDQRHHALPGRDVSAGPQIHVGDHAVDGSSDLAAIEIELGDRAVGNRRIEGRLGLELGREHLLLLLLRDGIGRQRAVALQIGIGLIQRGLMTRHRRVGLPQRQREPFAVDLEQHIAAMDFLVVLDQHVRDEAGDVRRDLHHVGAHTAVTGPGLLHIIDPQFAADANRGDDSKDGQRKAD